MSKYWMIGIIVSWLCIFVGYILFQEISIATGTVVRLETKPVDPRDFFRGDYVILGYEIDDACDSDMYYSDLSAWEEFSSQKTVYVSLEMNGDIANATGCSTTKPTSDIYIKGYLHYNRTEFGIEKYFTQEGQGKDLENAVGNMHIQASISRSGVARIIDYRFLDAE